MMTIAVSILGKGQVVMGVLAFSRSATLLVGEELRLKLSNPKLPKLIIEPHTNCHWNKCCSPREEPEHKLLVLEEKKRNKKLLCSLESG